MTDFDSTPTADDPPSIGPDRSAPRAEDDLPEDPRILEVLQDYLAAVEEGRIPDKDEYAARYPELAEAITLCLEGLDLVRTGLPQQSSAAAFDGWKASPARGTSRLGGEPLGDFQILRELARGGMGIVYEAVQMSLGRRVALKVLPFAATFDSRQLQRFKNEAQAAALLHHTHIVPIYAVGCERGVHFYAMQLIEGQSLAAVIKRLRDDAGLSVGGPPDGNLSSYVLGESGPGREAGSGPGTKSGPAALHSTADVSASLTSGASRSGAQFFRRAARLMVQAAEALEHAHQLGVVHRDVKPANLLVNSAGNLWVTDFGLAQLQADNGLTRSGDVLGTFRYMSPEQTAGQRAGLDARTDVYSLGATFYELVTLEPAFDGETRPELLYQIIHKEPRPPRQVNHAIPPELETIILKAMSKNRAERYATAAEFGADVQRFLDNQPILARRPSLIDRVRKWGRRHPSIVVAGVVVLLVVAVGLSISNRLISQEQQKTTEALVRERLRANEADTRFRQARQAVDLLIQMSEEELADVPMVQGTRKRLLETAVGFYQDFVDQQSGNAESQAELAAVQERVRGILRELTVLQREMQLELLNVPTVLDDLELAAESRPVVAEILRKSRDERDQATREKRGVDWRRRRFVEIAEDRERRLAEHLTAAQWRRLRQISIQTQGLFAFKDPDIVKALQLTAEQRLAIREVESEIFGSGFPRSIRIPGGPPMPMGGPDGRHPPGPGGPGGPRPDWRPDQPGPRPPHGPDDHHPGDRHPGDRHEEGGHGPRDMRWKVKLSRRESVEKILALLTEDQVKVWRELVGEPFTSWDEGPGGPPRP